MTQTDENGDDERDGTVESHHYDRDTIESCSNVVVSAVADTLNRSPLDLEPLYHRVDPEALDNLVDRSLGLGDSEDPSVRFSFAGCRVMATPVTVRVTPGADAK